MISRKFDFCQTPAINVFDDMLLTTPKPRRLLAAVTASRRPASRSCPPSPFGAGQYSSAYCGWAQICNLFVDRKNYDGEGA